MTTRRDVLHACAACGARLAIPCAGTAALDACAGLDLAVLEHDIVVPLSDYPDLATEGGIAAIPPDVSDFDFAIFVVNEGGGVLRALSAQCTHQGCSVNVSGARFVCPCHGSEFRLDGVRQAGPANDPLQVFDTMVAGDTLTILAP